MPARPLLILLSLAATSALAAPTIDPQFGDHAVIQRGKPVLLSGTAAPKERVTADFAGEAKVVSADASGRWEAAFAPRATGKDLRLSVTAPDGTVNSSDLAIGDVWLCSGQSNMEYPVRRALNSDGEVQNASDADLRLFKVPQQVADDPQAHFAKPPQWQVTSPDSVKDFSAACYFMSRDLRTSQHVP